MNHDLLETFRTLFAYKILKKRCENWYRQNSWLERPHSVCWNQEETIEKHLRNWHDSCWKALKIPNLAVLLPNSHWMKFEMKNEDQRSKRSISGNHWAKNTVKSPKKWESSKKINSQWLKVMIVELPLNYRHPMTRNGKRNLNLCWDDPCNDQALSLRGKDQRTIFESFHGHTLVAAPEFARDQRHASIDRTWSKMWQSLKTHI